MESVLFKNILFNLSFVKSHVSSFGLGLFLNSESVRDVRLNIFFSERYTPTKLKILKVFFSCFSRPIFDAPFCYLVE